MQNAPRLRDAVKVRVLQAWAVRHMPGREGEMGRKGRGFEAQADG